MLKPIEHILKNPNDLPDIPRATKEYLQSRYNATFLYEAIIPNLRTKGHTEEFISGVIQGFNEASKVIDEMEARKALINSED